MFLADLVLCTCGSSFHLIYYFIQKFVFPYYGQKIFSSPPLKLFWISNTTDSRYLKARSLSPNEFSTV